MLFKDLPSKTIQINEIQRFFIMNKKLYGEQQQQQKHKRVRFTKFIYAAMSALIR